MTVVEKHIYDCTREAARRNPFIVVGNNDLSPIPYKSWSYGYKRTREEALQLAREYVHSIIKKQPNTTVQRWGHPGKYRFPDAALGKNDKDDIGSRAHWRKGSMTTGRHRREMEEKGLAGNLEGEYSTSADSLKKIGSDIFMEGLRARRRRAGGEKGARGYCVVGNARHFTEEVLAFANRVDVDLELK